MLSKATTPAGIALNDTIAGLGPKLLHMTEAEALQLVFDSFPRDVTFSGKHGDALGSLEAFAKWLAGSRIYALSVWKVHGKLEILDRNLFMVKVSSIINKVVKTEEDVPPPAPLLTQSELLKACCEEMAQNKTNSSPAPLPADDGALDVYTDFFKFKSPPPPPGPPVEDPNKFLHMFAGEQEADDTAELLEFMQAAKRAKREISQ